MRIRLINPNTSAAITEKMAVAARAVAAPGTLIEAVTPASGPVSIESHFDEAVAALGVAEEVRRGEAEGAEGYVLACFGDPGLLAARELARGPVVGIAEAAFHVAALIATRFSIVTTLPRTAIIAEHLLAQYGYAQHCRRVRAADIPVLDLEDSGSAAYARIVEECLRARDADGIGAIVLGCGGMADLAQAISRDIGLPVVEGVTAAVKLVEAVAGLGLGTSKFGDLAWPPAKRFTGAFAGYSA